MLALQVFRDGMWLGGRGLLIVSPAWYEAASLRAVPSD